MSELRQTMAKVMAAFADALDSMNDREFDLLIKGGGKLRFSEERQSGKKAVDDPLLQQDSSELARKLNDAETREDAERLFASIKQPRRKDLLLRVAKACGVSIGSKDSIAIIERKLIENVVGTKLRSEAIKKVAF